jgi:hypothetical protein
MDNVIYVSKNIQDLPEQGYSILLDSAGNVFLRFFNGTIIKNVVAKDSQDVTVEAA